MGLGRSAQRTKEKMTTTKMKDAAFNAKQSPGDPTASANAASIGPMIRPRLNCADESDTAASTSSRSTRSGSNDCHAAQEAALQNPSTTAR